MVASDLTYDFWPDVPIRAARTDSRTEQLTSVCQWGREGAPAALPLTARRQIE